MINYVAYRKFVTLKNGKRVMFRFLNDQDREALIQLFQEAPEEDIRFLKQDVKDLKLVNYWVDHLNYRKVLPLVAVDLERIGSLRTPPCIGASMPPSISARFASSSPAPSATWAWAL